MRKIRISLIAVYALFLLMPLITLIINTGGINNFISVLKDGSLSSYFFVRLFALYGLTMLTIQLLIGATMNFFSKLFTSKILKFHMAMGIFIYFIILSHVSLYAYTNYQDLGKDALLQTLIPNVNSQLQRNILFGEIGLILLTIAVISAIFRNKSFVAKYWRKFHMLNYVVLPVILIHSYLTGQDTKTAPFIYMYPIFILMFLFLTLNRFIFKKI